MKTIRLAATALAMAMAMAGSLTAVAAEAPAPSAIPLSAFAAHPDFTEVRLSPNGDYVAAIVRDDDRSRLSVFRTATLQPTAYLQFGAGNHVHDVSWASPQRLVLEMSKQSNAWSQPALTGELLAVDADGRNTRYLYGARVGLARDQFGWLVDALDDDDRRILIGQRPFAPQAQSTPDSVYSVDVDTGARGLVATAPVVGRAQFHADPQGQVLAVDVQGADGVSRLFLRDNPDAAWRPASSPAGTEVSVMRVERGGQILFAETTRAPQRSCLVRRAAGTLDGGVVLGCSEQRGGLFYSFDRRQVLGWRTWDSAGPHLVYFDKTHADSQMLQFVERDLGRDAALYLDYSRDGATALIKTLSDRNAGSYYLYERAQNRIRALMSSREALPAAAMSPRRALRLPAAAASDAAYLTLPVSNTGKPPLVVRLRGIYGATAGWGFSVDAQALASRGYAVLDIDNYDRPDLAPRIDGAPDPVLALSQTLIDNLRWLRTQGQVDGDRICLHGESYGAYLALTVATRAPELVRCVISEAGIVDIAAWRRGVDPTQTVYGRQNLDRYMTGTGSTLSSPLAQIGALKAPVLLIHGKSDSVVDFAQARLLIKALDEQQLPHTDYFEPNEAHDVYQAAHRVKRYEQMLAFLQQNLAGVPAAR